MLARYVAWWATSTCVLALLQAGLETVLVARAGAELSSALASGLLSGALTLLLLSAVSPLCLAVAWGVDGLRGRRLGTLWAGLLLALPSLGLALLIADPRNRISALPYVVIALGACGAVLAAAWFVVAEPRRNGKLAAALLALGACALDVWVGPESYPEVHGLCLLVLGAALASLLADVRRTERSGRRLALGTLVVLAGALGVVHGIARARPAVYSWSVLHGRNVARTSAWLRLPFDRDGDGFASILWGLDCNDADPRVYPGALDPPGQGDQNCNGVDGAERAPAEFFTNAPGAPPTLSRGAIERVVLLSLDTFRPELLRADVMPNLTRFVAHGARFSRSYASATATTGSLPLFHQLTLDGPSIAEALTGAGIASHAVGQTARLSHVVAGKDDAQQPAIAIELLERAGTQPTYLWTHFMGLHASYKLWPDASSPPALPPFSPAYVSEAVHLDRVLAPLLDWLARPEHLARSVILVTGDHGEGWGEHGNFSHASLAWQELVRTPIVLLAPGLPPGEYGQLVSHRDFPATILGAFGLERETEDAERFGRSLLRLIGHESTPLRTAVVCHSSRQASGALGHGPLGIMIDGSMKLVVGVTDGIAELYDLAADPEERTNLAAQKPALTAKLRRKLSGYLDAEHYPALPARAERERQLGRH